MVCSGFEPVATGWKSQTNPQSNIPMNKDCDIHQVG